ncbi:AraC family transcriptional regulator [Kiritimatiellota bacterium B12222]|nr:AraC family transcriptional regulator [Kiritimatiellota bacterium B12222]
MKTSSQKSDFISTFLTSQKGNPQQGIAKPGTYVRNAIRWWSAQCQNGNAGLFFLHPIEKDSHLEWKFFLQLQGENELTSPQTTLRIPTGSVGVLQTRPGVKEEWIPDSQGQYSHLFIGIYSERLSSNFVYDTPARIRSAISLPFTQNTLFRRMLHFASSAQPASSPHAQVIADILLDGMRISTENAPSRLIQKALQHILDHPCNPDLSVKWIAQQLDCHPDYLSRRFHQETGTALMKYVRSKRMEIAADLLHSHKMCVADVAASCGYRDHSYFTRIFHKTYGVIPSQWVRKYPR